MSLSNRMLFVVMGVVIAYFAVVAGSSFQPYIKDVAPFSLIALVLALIFGIFIWGIAMGQIIDHDDSPDMFAAAAALVCACLLFGAITAPATDGTWISAAWFNGWTFLPLIAAVPLVVGIKDICLDVIYGIIRYRADAKARKLASEKIIPFRTERK